MWHSCLHLLENESGAANVSKLNFDEEMHIFCQQIPLCR